MSLVAPDIGGLRGNDEAKVALTIRGCWERRPLRSFEIIPRNNGGGRDGNNHGVVDVEDWSTMRKMEVEAWPHGCSELPDRTTVEDNDVVESPRCRHD